MSGLLVRQIVAAGPNALRGAGPKRLWLVGQLIQVVLMAACVWLAQYLLGLPGAFLLGVQAGISNLVPYLGPILAGIPVGLVAMPLGPRC